MLCRSDGNKEQQSAQGAPQLPPQGVQQQVQQPQQPAYSQQDQMQQNQAYADALRQEALKRAILLQQQQGRK